MNIFKKSNFEERINKPGTIEYEMAQKFRKRINSNVMDDCRCLKKDIEFLFGSSNIIDKNDQTAKRTNSTI